MPKIGAWNDFPLTLREHLIERMHSRNISLDDALADHVFAICGIKVPYTSVRRMLRPLNR